jgi:hypothetical protein
VTRRPTRGSEHLLGSLHHPSRRPDVETEAAAAPRLQKVSPTLGGITRVSVPGARPPKPGVPGRDRYNQAHMARPALFVLAVRRRYLRRFLSPRNQQNPKRSLGKMKGAEGPGRGGPRGCRGQQLAPDRRRSPGGERARPWGVPRACLSGVEPGGNPLPTSAWPRSGPRHPHPSSSPDLFRAVFSGTAPSPLRKSDFFKAPLKLRAPPQDRRFRTWAGAGVGRGLVTRARPASRLGPPIPSHPSLRLSRPGAMDLPSEGTVASQPRAWGKLPVRPLSAVGEPWGARRAQSPIVA